MAGTCNRGGEVRLQELVRAPPGAIPGPGPGVSTVFGNDGYSVDPRSRREVEALRGQLRAPGIEELGFGLESPEGYSRALIVRGDHVEYLDDAVHRCWSDVCSGRYGIAPDGVDEAPDAPGAAPD